MSKDQGLDQIVGLYAALLISCALILAPNLIVMTMSGAIFLCLVLFAYMMRIDQEPDSPRALHGTYVIRTFWISLVLLVLGLLLSIGGLTIFMQNGHLDISALKACSGGNLGPCLPIFIDDNSFSLKAASFVAAGPSILYLLYRFARGLVRARGGAASVL